MATACSYQSALAPHRLVIMSAEPVSAMRYGRLLDARKQLDHPCQPRFADVLY